MTDSAIAGADGPTGLMDTVAEQRRAAIARAVEDTALDLFVERPMVSVTVGEIAAAAGISVRTLYRYFPTKEHVFTGMPRRGAEQVAARLEAQPATVAPFEALQNAVREASDLIDRDELARWMKALFNSGATDRLARVAFVTSTSGLADALAGRVDLPPDHLWVEMAGSMVAGALSVGTRHWAISGGDLQEQILAVLNIVGRGLREWPA